MKTAKRFFGLLLFAGLFILSFRMLDRRIQQTGLPNDPLPRFCSQSLPLLVLGHQFSQAFVLDPNNRELILMGANLLAGVKIDEALSLLDEGMLSQPSEWKYPELAGFLYFYHKKDPVMAARLYERAARLPGHPPFVPSIASKLYEESGFFTQAIGVLKNLAHDSRDMRVRQGFESRVEEIETRLQKRMFRVPVELLGVLTFPRLQVRMNRFNPYAELESTILIDLLDQPDKVVPRDVAIITSVLRSRLGQEIWIQLETDEAGRLLAVGEAWVATWLEENGEPLLPKLLEAIQKRSLLHSGDPILGYSGQIVQIRGHLQTFIQADPAPVWTWLEQDLPRVLLAVEDLPSFLKAGGARWLGIPTGTKLTLDALMTASSEGVAVVHLLHPDQINPVQE
jgi:hypothetical protein